MKLGLCDMGIRMKVKCSVYIAASIDGFIAKPDGDIDWLLRPEYVATEMKGLLRPIHLHRRCRRDGKAQL